MALGLGHDLRMKYGLTDDPSDDAIEKWADRVAELVEQGAEAGDAGRQASLDVFGELDALLYFSEADTIESLLARAQAK